MPRQRRSVPCHPESPAFVAYPLFGQTKATNAAFLDLPGLSTLDSGPRAHRMEHPAPQGGIMAVKTVTLKPIGAAIEKAQAQLRLLAKEAPPQNRKRINDKIKDLNIVLKKVKVLCAAPKSRPPAFGLCKGKASIRPFGISAKWPC
jgi:hypothetical protein